METNIDYYDEVSKNIIDNMDSVKQFKNDFNDKYAEVYRFKASNSGLQKLLHPIKLIRNRRDSKNLEIIYKGFYDIYNKSVVKFVKEETGDLNDDLRDPTFKVKPDEMDKYVKSIKLKK